MYRIGIDLGGTNIAVGVVNDRYEIVARRSVPTGAERPAEEVIRDMGDAVEEALRQAGLTAVDCASMGVGSPGACDPQTGVVKRAYNLNWFDVPVCRMLHQRFGIPVRLGNDANCAALAEVVARYAVYVAAGLTDFVNILAPEMILLGGGISRQGEALLAPIREYVATHCFGQREGAIPTIAAAKLGNEAGIIGAAAL